MNAVECLDIDIHDIRIHPVEDEYVPVTIVTDRGEVQVRYYPVPRAEQAVVCVGGDWDSPGAGQLYPRLCRDMQAAGIAALRVCCRRPAFQPTFLPAFQEDAVLDVLAGLHILAGEGMRRFAIVGHSHIAPVAALAATRAPGARGLVTIGSQAHGLEAVGNLPAGCASLFIHGAADGVLPPSCSRYGYDLAPAPRLLRLFEDAGHDLDEVADALHLEVRRWLLTTLERPDHTSPG